MKLRVPFFSNTADNYHCFQAALRMVLAYFHPERTYDWQELDRLTAHTSNYTWPSAGLLYCASIGLQVRVIDAADFERFSTEGYDYLAEVLGKEVADDQRNNSDLAQEMLSAKRLLARIPVEKRIPSQADLRGFLSEGAPVVCNVNARALRGQQGYTGHFIVAIGANDEGLWLHDPGLPPIEDVFFPWDRFDHGWSYPDSRARNIIAFRKETS